MAVLPQSLSQRIEFLEARISKWNDVATQIGLTVQQVTVLEQAIIQARAALTERDLTRAVAKSATENYHNVGRQLSDLASDAIKAIKLKAALNNDPNVYVLANIPAPQPPTPPPPPQPPTDFIADPNADGTVTLKWKGSVANQTFFSIYRKLGSGEWMNLGSTALKTFTDQTIPSPVPSLVLYQVRSQRQNVVSAPSSTAGVAYGAGGQGVAIAGFVGESDFAQAA
jgi:hypothetical protein